MNYTKVHMGSGTDMVLQSPVDENAYLKIDLDQYFKNLLSTTTMREKLEARMASGPLCALSIPR